MDIGSRSKAMCEPVHVQHDIGQNEEVLVSSSSELSDTDSVLDLISDFCSDRSKCVSFKVGGKGGIQFKSFNDLFETLMCAVANGYLTLKRMRKSVNCIYPEGYLKYVDNESSSWVSYRGKKKAIWQIGQYDIEGVLDNCYRKNVSVPHKAPLKVELEKTWCFVYKDEISYRLQQVFTGKSKNIAFCSPPKYFLVLEIHNTLRPKGPEQIMESVFLKLRDFLSVQ